MSATAPLTGLQDDPERRFLRAGRVAHLIAYGNDYGAYPYTRAYCGRSPSWPGSWYGSGTQAEIERAARLPLCATCAVKAAEVLDFVTDLKGWLSS